jgi:mannobiose 2-epimerase
VRELGDRLRVAILDPGGRSQTLDALRLRGWDLRARRVGLPNHSVEAAQPASTAELHSADFYRRYLLDDLLPFWARAENAGVFRISLRKDATGWDGPAPSATAQARMVYAFSRGEAVDSDSGYGEVAARAVDYLIRAYWDRDYGGWYRQVDSGGTVVDDSKYFFDQAYVISGLAEYLRVTGDERVRGYLIDTLKLVEAQVWDSEHTGYFDWLERDWSIRRSRKTLCIHVDLLAGLLAAHAVLPDWGLLDKAHRLADVMRSRMVDPRSGLPLEVFRRDFVYSPFRCDDTLVTGHAFKVAKHFLTVSDLSGDSSYAKRARRMVDASLELAWDREQGGLFHEFFRSGAIKSGDKVWWSLCEGLITLLMMFERTGEQTYLDRYLELAAFSFAHFADSEFGEWITSTHRDGSPKCTHKGGTLEKARSPRKPHPS